MTVGCATPEMKILTFFAIGTLSLKVTNENPMAVMAAKMGKAVILRLLEASANMYIRRTYVPMKTKNGNSANKRGLVMRSKCSFFNIVALCASIEKQIILKTYGIGC